MPLKVCNSKEFNEGTSLFEKEAQNQQEMLGIPGIINDLKLISPLGLKVKMV